MAVLVLLLSGCSGDGKKTFSTLSDFEGQRVGSLTGAVFGQFIDRVIPNVKHSNFNTLSDQVAALKAGKVDALALDKPVAELLVAQQGDLSIFPDKVADDRYGFAVSKNSQLLEQANGVLEKLKENGTLAEIGSLWFSADETKKALPNLDYKPDFDGSAGTIKYGFDTSTVPMSYVGGDGQPVGFDLDIISRIAYELNMKIEFVPMNFDALLASLASGKVDVVGGCMSITEERQKTVDFIGPYYEGGIVLVVNKDRLGR